MICGAIETAGASIAAATGLRDDRGRLEHPDQQVGGYPDRAASCADG
jgi:hypothetical protein